jgi:hypothetical protein
MPRRTEKEIAHLRKLDDLFREWKPPKDFTVRISRDETYGFLNVGFEYRKGGVHDFEVQYSDTLAKSRAKLESEFQSFKAKIEAGEA